MTSRNARLGDALLTPPPLEAVWPAVSRRLLRWLERRHVDGPTAEDVCQETAARLIAHSVQYRDADDLFRWASVVAWRVFIDGCRRQDRVSYGVPERAARVDVASEVEHRLEVAKVAECFPVLTDAERAILLDAGSASSRREQSRLAKRRQRARQHLLALIDGLAALTGWLYARQRSARTASVLALATPLLLVVSVAVLPHVSDRAAERSRATAQRSPATAQRAKASLDASSSASPSRPRSHGAAAVTANGPSRGGGDSLRRVQTDVPTPIEPTSIGTRPKEPDDHFLCATLTGIGSRCVDLPVRVTG